MNPVGDAADARPRDPEPSSDERLAAEVAHKEHLLALEFISEEHLSRRIRRIEWSVLGAVVFIAMLLLVETLGR